MMMQYEHRRHTRARQNDPPPTTHSVSPPPHNLARAAQTDDSEKSLHCSHLSANRVMRPLLMKSQRALAQPAPPEFRPSPLPHQTPHKRDESNKTHKTERCVVQQTRYSEPFGSVLQTAEYYLIMSQWLFEGFAHMCWRLCAITIRA